MPYNVVVDRHGVPHHVTSRTIKIPISFACHYRIGIKIGGTKVAVDSNGNLLNPQQYHFEDWHGMHKCNLDCYKWYTMFLRSKNYTHFLIARRRFTNEHKRQY